MLYEVRQAWLDGTSSGEVVYYFVNFHQAVGRLSLSTLEEKLAVKPNAVHEIGNILFVENVIIKVRLNII